MQFLRIEESHDSVSVHVVYTVSARIDHFTEKHGPHRLVAAQCKLANLLNSTVQTPHSQACGDVDS